VGVMFGKGDGGFANYASYPTAGLGGVYPYRHPIALGDLNGDGELDIAKAIVDGDAVDVLLGTGGGGFATFTGYATGAEPESIALGDLDGDGRLDMVTANTSAGTVSVLLGRGDGTFAESADYPTGGSPTFAVLGDVNGDGKLDVVVTNGSWTYTSQKGTVSVLLGTGDGKLAAHADYPAGVRPMSLALGDINGDGKLDVAVANEGIDGYWSVGLLLGKGDGTFTTAKDASTDSAYSMIALADLDADGRLDLVLADTWADRVSVLLGKGNATFGARADYQTTSDVASVALGDLNGDGKLDIVTVSSGAMDVLLGKGDGTFASRVSYAAAAGTLALGDIDGNGRLDVAVGLGGAVNILFSVCQ
jgi:hypothetical protein